MKEDKLLPLMLLLCGIAVVAVVALAYAALKLEETDKPPPPQAKTITPPRTPEQLGIDEQMMRQMAFTSDADTAFAKGKYSKALPLFDRMIKNAEQNGMDMTLMIRPLEQRAVCYQKLGQNAEAIADLKRAIELRRQSGRENDAGYVNDYFTWGYALFGLHQFDEAQSKFEEAQKLRQGLDSQPKFKGAPPSRDDLHMAFASVAIARANKKEALRRYAEIFKRPEDAQLTRTNFGYAALDYAQLLAEANEAGNARRILLLGIERTSLADENERTRELHETLKRRLALLVSASP